MTASHSPMSEVALSPGWLARDVTRVSTRFFVGLAWGVGLALPIWAVFFWAVWLVAEGRVW